MCAENTKGIVFERNIIISLYAVYRIFSTTFRFFLSKLRVQLGDL